MTRHMAAAWCVGLVVLAGVLASGLEPAGVPKPPVLKGAWTEPVLMRLKLKAGDVLKAVIDEDQTVTGSAGDKERRDTQKRRTESSFKVERVDADGNIRGVSVVTRLKVTTTGESDFEMDSDAEPKDSPKYKAMSYLVNVGVPMTLSPTGEVISADATAMKEAYKAAGNSAEPEVLKNGIKKIFGGTIPHFSTDAVRNGETFKSAVDTDQGVKVQMQFKIAAVSEGGKKVLLEPAHTFELIPGKTHDIPLKITKQEVKGWDLFDAERGVPESSHLSIRMAVEAEVNGVKIRSEQVGVINATFTLESK